MPNDGHGAVRFEAEVFRCRGSGGCLHAHHASTVADRWDWAPSPLADGDGSNLDLPRNPYQALL